MPKERPPMDNIAPGKLLTEAAYDRIKHAIITCELAPGQSVTEEQLATSYDVGRAGVRAALKRLCQENLVVLASRKRYVVAPITLKHVNELFELREMLEPLAACKASSRISPDTLDRLERLGTVDYLVGDHESAAAFLRANTEFHATIAEAAGNALIADVIRGTLDKVERVHHMAHLLRDRNDVARHEHGELIEALTAGDGKRAEQVMVAQIRDARSFVIEAMIASPRLQSANVSLDATH
jgi:DNA-binding GntR family transcriptional regulator